MGKGVAGSLPLALRLARRELRGGLKGFRIFLACLTLGVAAIAGVGSVSEAMLQGLQRDGRSLLGGDMDLRLTHVEASAEQLAWLGERAEISTTSEMRAMARGLDEGSRRVLVELKAVDNLYPLYGAVELAPALDLDKALAQQDGVWGTVVDGNLLRRLEVELGELVQIGDTQYQVRAVLEREPDRTSRAFTLGPTFMVQQESLAATGLVQPGSLIRNHYRLRLDSQTSAAALRSDLTETFPEAGWRIRDTTQAAPGIGRFIDRLTLFLTLVGLTALLVGGVGVGNAVRSYLDGKTGTIATMKCLGAPGRLVFQIYMAQILALALVGIVIGVAIGALSPPAAQAVIGDALGWRAELAIYPVPLLTAAAFGILTAITFSLLPLARARAVPAASLFRDLITPAKALPDRSVLPALVFSGGLLAGLAVLTASDRMLAFYFVVGAIAALALFRLAAQAIISLSRRLPRSRRPGLRLAITNLHRPGAPTGSVVMSLGLGLTVLVAIALIEGNLSRQLQQSLPEEAPGFYFIDIQPDQVADFDSLVAGLPGITEVQRVPMLRGRISAVNGVSPRDMEIPADVQWIFRGDRGLTWMREPRAGDELTAGDWWPADYSGDPLVSLDNDVGQALGIGPGDKLSVNILGRDVEVTIANLRVIDWSNLTINFVMVFSPGLLEQAPQSHIATVKAEPEAEDGLEIAVTDRFINVSSIRVKEALEQVGQLMTHIATAVRAIAAVALAAGVLVLAGAVAAGHHRRVYDAVVLKVLGATRRVIAQAFLLEYGLLGLVTATIAAAIGSLAAYLVLTEIMGTPFVFMPQAVLTTALLATAITVAFGFAGTWRALGQKAAPLLRNE
ncbi:FtsX-like permease family protein [Pelagibius litoralis]|uniref:FtsX-like permease family protein n=2 Tax=Pelagibius litoralis TaxID=374515 RepID=A0A967F159_9PROT|nr:FtsX-like permease family protein [Pelagibius litoralis]